MFSFGEKALTPVRQQSEDAEGCVWRQGASPIGNGGGGATKNRPWKIRSNAFVAKPVTFADSVDYRNFVDLECRAGVVREFLDPTLYV